EARLDILDDPRLSRGLLSGPTALEPQLIARVVRDKICAATAYGYDGIESSLRFDAQQAMLEDGIRVEAARQMLDAAARLIAPPAPPDMRVQIDGRFAPSVMAGMTFVACALVSLILYQMMGFHPLLLVA